MEITEKKIDDRSSEFTIRGEDHTLANLVCSALRNSPHVTFAGYRMPHPLSKEVVIFVKTDKTTTPADALADASERLRELLLDFAASI